MTTGYSLYGWLTGLGRGLLRWLMGWWTVLFTGAQVAVLAFSPSSYGPEARGAGCAVLGAAHHAFSIRLRYIAVQHEGYT